MEAQSTPQEISPVTKPILSPDQPSTESIDESSSSSDHGKDLTLTYSLRTCQVRIRTGEKPISCSDCGKSFPLKIDLLRHQRKHRGEKPFSCSECGKSFDWRKSLFRHEQIHSSEKPFSCSECRQCFSQESTLLVHKRIHTGEKPFCCVDCGKRFISEYHLLYHERSHKNQIPTRKITYACTDCGLQFSKKSDFVLHKKGHTLDGSSSHGNSMEHLSQNDDTSWEQSTLVSEEMSLVEGCSSSNMPRCRKNENKSIPNYEGISPKESFGDLSVKQELEDPLGDLPVKGELNLMEDLWIKEKIKMSEDLIKEEVDPSEMLIKEEIDPLM